MGPHNTPLVYEITMWFSSRSEERTSGVANHGIGIRVVNDTAQPQVPQIKQMRASSHDSCSKTKVGTCVITAAALIALTVWVFSDAAPPWQKYGLLAVVALLVGLTLGMYPWHSGPA